jgi:hypothetical protein
MASFKRKAIVSYEFNFSEAEAQELKAFMDSHKEEIADEGGFVEEFHSELEKALAPRAKPGRKSGSTPESSSQEQAQEVQEEAAPEAPPEPASPPEEGKKERVVRDRNGNVVEKPSTRVTVPV